ncbi:MAG TPA: DUF3368 domain-containing protein [Planctomycetota bacterium]|nr:DUF3368 domain-containing protein [Planctomycetota bacterium]
MSHVVIADAGPLIALARTGRLSLLPDLFDRVWIPEAVRDELETCSDRPGAKALKEAIGPRGWLKVARVSAGACPEPALGQGEWEAIALATRESALLLIDERPGRRAAKAAGVEVIGTGTVLLLAKSRGIVPRVSPILDELINADYRLSAALVRHLKELAGER